MAARDDDFVPFAGPGILSWPIDLDGGSPVTVGPEVHGQWTRAGEIVATTGPPQWSLRRVAVGGGSVVDMLKPSPGERFGVPSLLPSLTKSTSASQGSDSSTARSRS